MSSTAKASNLASVAGIGLAATGLAITTLLYRKYNSPPVSNMKTQNNASTKYFLLAGDVGGTNIRLALYDPTISPTSPLAKTPIFTREYRNSKYITDDTKTFEIEIIDPFLQEWHETSQIFVNVNNDIKVEIVSCFAVAGPVKDNVVLMTNLGGHVSPDVEESDVKGMEIEFNGNTIEKSNHGMLSLIKRALVVNDFVGQGYGCLDLDHDTETIPLHTPSDSNVSSSNGPKVCVGAGTGLGECFLTPDDNADTYTCYPSEGGHVDYTPRTDLQYQLSKYLKEEFSQEYRISVERVVSGKGLANIYKFLSETFPDEVNPTVQEEFDGAEDMQGRVVGTYANGKGESGVNGPNNNSDDLCVRAMEIMMAAYGAEVGNCAVKFIPTGGMYVTGGLTPKNINFIRAGGRGDGESSEFLKAYWDKGRVSGVLDGIPLFAVKVEDLGLRGARVCAFKEYNKILKRGSKNTNTSNSGSRLSPFA